ncbi:MAG: tetratricopeptide repeat protein [Nitrospirae bacterium]|nr:tetratricopeptide repeat protein [Nitrospirota bacterium]
MRNLHPSFILAGVVSFVYINSLWGSYQFDDFNVIVNNSVVHSWHTWLADVPVGIRPVLKFTYMINWTSDMGVFGFHLINIAIHSVNAIFVYLLSLRLTSHLGNSSKGVSLITALLFALHPVQTEAVTYISGRSTSLMAMFYLGSLFAFAYGSDKKNRLWLYVVSPVLFILAVLTKETAVTLPLALLLWEKAYISEKTCKFALKKHAVHWVVLILMFLIFAIHNGYSWLLLSGFEIRGIKDNFLSQINGISYLISRLFLINRLNIDPDLPVLSRWTPLLIAEGSVLFALALTGFIALNRRRLLGFGLIWFFLHLMPTNSIIPRFDVANERQLYLALWGVSIALFVEVRSLQTRFMQYKHVLFRAGTIILLLVLGFFTIARNHAYRSEIALWEDTARKSPSKARVYNNLGYAYYLSGRYEEAKSAYLTALSLKPDFSLARSNLLELEKKQSKLSKM